MRGGAETRLSAIALGFLALAAIYLFTFSGRSLVVQPFNIPSVAQEPTLLVGDYIFVSKSVYGYSRYSFPLALIPIAGRVFASQPERGDMVVFKYPIDNTTDYVKRIVGLPGDRIQMKEGVLYINDKAVPKQRVEDYIEEVGGQQHRVDQYQIGRAHV